MFRLKALPSLITERITEHLTWWAMSQSTFFYALKNPDGRSLSLTFYSHPAQCLLLHLYNLERKTPTTQSHFFSLPFCCSSSFTSSARPYQPFVVNSSCSSSKKPWDDPSSNQYPLNKSSQLLQPPVLYTFIYSLSPFSFVYLLAPKQMINYLRRGLMTWELKGMTLSPASTISYPPDNCFMCED